WDRPRPAQEENMRICGNAAYAVSRHRLRGADPEDCADSCGFGCPGPLAGFPAHAGFQRREALLQDAIFLLKGVELAAQLIQSAGQTLVLSPGFLFQLVKPRE